MAKSENGNGKGKIEINSFQKFSLVILRVVLGWMFFWAGIIKFLDAKWSAGGYISSAKTFAPFYKFLAEPRILPLVNNLNKWGLAIIGLLLILGLFTRVASVLAIFLMALYYFPILKFPYPSAHSFIVDEHIIYIGALFALAAFHAGRIVGLDTVCARLPFCSRHPHLRDILG